jgi:predicted HTH domain antitoxin
MDTIIIKPRDHKEFNFFIELIRRLGVNAKTYEDLKDEELLQVMEANSVLSGVEQKPITPGVVDKTVCIHYPSGLPDAMHLTSHEFEQEAKMAMAVKLFELKRISSGTAASMAGIDRVSFLLNLHRYGVDMMNMEVEELHSDMENA